MIKAVTKEAAGSQQDVRGRELFLSMNKIERTSKKGRHYNGDNPGNSLLGQVIRPVLQVV
jgi:hypothetical protein